MREAIDQIENWVEEFAIDCGFSRQTGYLYAEPGQDTAYIEKELAAARRAGVEIEEERTRPPLPFATESAYSVGNQAQIDPARYLRGLAEAFVGDGCEIREGVRVRDFHDGTPCRVETDGRELTAEALVLATHTPLARSVLHTMLEPWRSYIMVARLQEEVPRGLFWDAAEPYHYLRAVDYHGERALLVGGADHKTGHSPKENPYLTLERYTRDRFSVRDVVARWSAQYYSPVDTIPFIGTLPLTRHVYVGTGYDGDGLTLGTFAGKLIAHRIINQDLIDSHYFSPLRLKAAAIPNFAQFQFEAALHFVTDRLSTSNANELGKLPPGSGAVIHEDNRSWACYRDEDGELLTHSARCPHLGCIVQWNAQEKTWDCPCHGGRFAPDGCRLEGPPRADLSPAKPGVEKHS